MGIGDGLASEGLVRGPAPWWCILPEATTFRATLSGHYGFDEVRQVSVRATLVEAGCGVATLPQLAVPLAGHRQLATIPRSYRPRRAAVGRGRDTRGVTVNVIRTAIPEVLILAPRVFGDDRGFFVECYNQAVLADVAGIEDRFVQDNHSGSRHHVVRGLHYQIEQPQGKLVRVIAGEVFDVAVDLRRGSPTFGRWVGATLSAQTMRMVWVPRGFAHGFLVLSTFAEVLYKATDYYAPQHERCVAWNDPAIGIRWPLTGEPILSAKDRAGRRLAEAETFE